MAVSGRASLLGALLCVGACSPAQAPTAEPTVQAAEEPAVDPAEDPKCHPAKPAQRVEVAAGETSEPVDDIVVTYVTYVPAVRLSAGVGA